MQKTLLFAIGSIGILALIISSCSKKNDSAAATMKNVAGTYKLTAATGSYGGLTVNIYDSIPACQKDDNIKFNADSSYQYIDAGTQCVPPGDYQGTWVIKDNLFILDSKDTATIKSFSGSQLVISYTDNSYGFPLVATETLTKL